ncbi:DUF4259 domain-containing protein [Mariniblastus sp.]|nr:DUF4259 domain-containing protein [Mariniblastus sp.]
MPFKEETETKYRGLAPHKITPMSGVHRPKISLLRLLVLCLAFDLGHHNSYPPLRGIMGAWDNGLLDNDQSQDFIGEFVRGIEEDIIAIHETRSGKLAGTLSAAVGVLLRLSHPFDPMPGLEDPPHFYPRLISALSANLERFMKYKGDAPQVLVAVLTGQGSTQSSHHLRLRFWLQYKL